MRLSSSLFYSRLYFSNIEFKLVSYCFLLRGFICYLEAYRRNPSVVNRDTHKPEDLS